MGGCSARPGAEGQDVSPEAQNPGPGDAISLTEGKPCANGKGLIKVSRESCDLSCGVDVDPFGGGTFRQSDGCTGRWTASKQ